MEEALVAILQWKNEKGMVQCRIEVNGAMTLAEFKRLCAETLGVQDMCEHFRR